MSRWPSASTLACRTPRRGPELEDTQASHGTCHTTTIPDDINFFLGLRKFCGRFTVLSRHENRSFSRSLVLFGFLIPPQNCELVLNQNLNVKKTKITNSGLLSVKLKVEVTACSSSSPPPYSDTLLPPDYVKETSPCIVASVERPPSRPPSPAPGLPAPA